MSVVVCEIHHKIAVVTINRPEVLNCFNYETLTMLEETVWQLHTNPNVHVVIFTGAGDRAFSAGADLKERRTLPPEDVIRNVKKIGQVFANIEKMPQVTIAAMNGHAFGGGMELALACDFRIAVNEAKMGLTETSMAIIPGAGGTQRLPRLIGEAKAKELILTARKMTSEDAYLFGILNQVTTKDGLIPASMALADEILQNGPVAIRQAKFAIHYGMNTDLETGLAIEAKAYEVTIPTSDRMEALDAFAEKRKPQFTGK